MTVKLVSKTQYLAFWIATLVATGLRVFWLFAMTDLSDGTVKSPFSYYEYLFAAIYLVLGVLLTANSMTAKAKPTLSRRSWLLGITSLITAGCFLADAGLCLVRCLRGEPLLTDSLSFEAVLGVLDLLACGYFALFGLQKLEFIDLLLNPVLPLVTLLQMMLRLLMSFFRFTRVASMGEEQYMMLLLIGYSIFWIYYCRMATGLGAAKKGNRMLFAPMLAFFIGTFVLVPHMLAACFEPAILDSGNFTFSDFGTALFALACVNNMMTLKKKTPPAADVGVVA